MVTHKRFDSDNEDGDSTPAASLRNVPVERKSISKPRNTPAHKSRSVKSIRSQIRSIERLLKNRGSQLAPSAYEKKKAELAELARLRDEHDRRNNERKVATEYRMVKFIERRKLQRVLDKIIEHGDRPQDGEQKKGILRDLRYVDEYPKDKKYVALFPSGGHSDRSRAKVDAIRAEIERRSDASATGDAMIQSSVRDDDETQDDFFLEPDDA